MTTTHTRTPRPDAVEHEPIPTTCDKLRCAAAPTYRFELVGSHVRYFCAAHAASDVAVLAKAGRRLVLDAIADAAQVEAVSA